MKSQGRSEAELMGLCARGSAEAFGVLVRRHQEGLLRFFLRLGCDPHGAQDCSQETFLRLYRFRRRYRPTAPFPAFLCRLARHAWVDWKRRAARRSAAGSAALEEAAAAGPGPVDERLDLEEALLALPASLRWVVVLSVDQGLTYREIAAVLEIPVGTVKSRMYHAVRRLREALHVRLER